MGKLKRNFRSDFTILNSGKSWTSAESDKATIVWGGKELSLKLRQQGM
jgi:hypothetical protein